MELPIQEIHEGGAQIRVHENEYTISHYAELMADGWGTFPPLAVVKIDGRYVVADGHHRLKSAIRAGLSTVPVEIIGNSAEEALEHAIRSNNQNGLALTLADRQNMRRRAILELPNRSARYLANLCGCADTTIRRDMEDMEAAGLYKRQEKVKGRDGKVQSAQKKKSGAPNVAPEQAVEFVTCTQCGFQAPREMLDAPDSTWEKRDFNPETLRYEKFYCSEECLTNANGSKCAVGGVEGGGGINDPSQPANKPVTGDTGAYFRNYEFYQVSFKAPMGIEEIIRKVLAEELNASEILLQGNININLNNNINNNINNINNINAPKKSEFVFPIRRHVVKKGSPAVIETWYELSEEEILEFESTFPNLDVRAELKKCLLWNKLNPKKRKTKSGIKQHLNTWLANAKPGGKKQGILPNKKYQAAGLDFDSLEY